MQNRNDRSQMGVHWLRRHWVVLTAVALAAAVLLIGQPLRAADAQPAINQTVPPPTPRPTVENPSDDDDNNDDNNNNNSDNNSTGSASAGQAAGAAAGDTAQSASVAASNGLTATVNVLALNVRQGPGVAFPVVGKFTQGAALTVEARNAAGDWLLVCCIPGTTTSGWVSASLVSPGFAAEQGAALPLSDGAVAATPLTTTATVTATAVAPVAATPVPGSQSGIVAGVNLNVRQGPGTDNAVIGKLRGDDAVSVLGRNAAGDWLYICCIGDPPANGWVSAQFITLSTAVSDLDEVSTSAAPAAPAATPEPPADATSGTPASTGTTATAGSGGLSVAIAQQPPFAVQGREVALVYTVRNDSGADLADVMLSSELPGPLTLVGATASGASVSQQEPSSVEITWPTLAAGESATATVRVRVAEDVPNGTTFANLATVSAGGSELAANGITIGMPPALLPEFW